jgi:penicillin-binding protein 2
VVAAAAFCLMGVRLWYLQVLDRAAFERTVVANQLRLVEIPPPRGLILGSRGQVLVGDQVTQDVLLSRQAARHDPEVVARLAALTGVSPATIEQDLANPQYSPYEPVPVVRDAPPQVVLYLGEHQSEFPGVTTVADTVPSYPLGDTGAQVFGYLGPLEHPTPGYQLGDQVGVAGLEATYEHVLRGVPGVDRVEVDATGRVVGNLGEVPARPGDDLVTNIDPGLEQFLQQAIDQEVASLQGRIDPSTGKVISATGGAGVVLDPNTGAVLAIVSSPSYDPTWWIGGMSDAHWAALQNPNAHAPLLDRAIDGMWAPGSTFKLVTATAALDDGLITANTVIDDPGTFTIPGCHGKCVFHDNDNEAAGPITVSRAISVSSDVFFYNLGYDFYVRQRQFGPTPIQDMAANYGYGQRTGIDLPGEAAGIVDSYAARAKLHREYPNAYPPPSWYAGDNLELAFGQGGTLVTPIQQAVAFATFANGGTRYVPRIAAGVVSASGRVLARYGPEVAGHVPLPPSTRDPMLTGFEGAVSSPGGTAYGVFQSIGFPLSQFPIAAKTGTASAYGQVPTSWFVAFGPVGAPRYVVAVVIEHAGYGASAAAPVVAKTFQYLLAHPAAPAALPPVGSRFEGGVGSLPGGGGSGSTGPAVLRAIGVRRARAGVDSRGDDLAVAEDRAPAYEGREARPLRRWRARRPKPEA